MAVKYAFQMVIKIPTFSIPRPSEIGIFGLKLNHLATLVS
jgi:hypothetical protein